LHLGHSELHYLRIKFHENLPSGSEVISGGQTDTTGDLISLLSFLESRLKSIANITQWSVWSIYGREVTKNNGRRTVPCKCSPG
jgi:hypothetical protein